MANNKPTSPRPELTALQVAIEHDCEVIKAQISTTLWLLGYEDGRLENVLVDYRPEAKKLVIQLDPSKNDLSRPPVTGHELSPASKQAGKSLFDGLRKAVNQNALPFINPAKPVYSTPAEEYMLEIQTARPQVTMERIMKYLKSVEHMNAPPGWTPEGRSR